MIMVTDDGAGGVDPRLGSGLRGLSDREAEVLRLVASGRSNIGVATDLVISLLTVDAHLRSIFTKLKIEADPDDNQRVLAALDWLNSRTEPGAPLPG